jgi:hypothetical protein
VYPELPAAFPPPPVVLVVFSLPPLLQAVSATATTAATATNRAPRVRLSVMRVPFIGGSS